MLVPNAKQGIGMKSVVIQQVAFQGVWLACALGGADGVAWPGVAAAAAFLTIHLAVAPDPGRDLGTVGIALVLGWLLDSIAVGASFVSYPGSPLALGPSPLWMLSLWAAFALTVPVAFSWLVGRVALGAWFGAMGGLLAYFAGSRLGALEVSGGPGWGAIALGWGLAMPILVATSHRLSSLSFSDGPPRASGSINC